MRCSTARPFIQEGLDGPLSPADEALLEAHLVGCESCRRYRAGLRRTASMIGGLQRERAPIDFGSTVSFQLRREATGRQWGFPVAIAAAFVAGLVLTVPNLRGGDLTTTARAHSLQEQMAADQAQAEFMHWMDPSADGGSGLDVSQAAFELPPQAAGYGVPTPEQSGR